jgi:hypothetical protein
MEAHEVRYIQLIDKHGENGEFAYVLKVPLNAPWETAHAAAANFGAALKELEEKNKKAIEEAQAAQAEPEPVAAEVVA